jgi:thiol-disulfide isomerase/thioredoxin
MIQFRYIAWLTAVWVLTLHGNFAAAQTNAAMVAPSKPSTNKVDFLPELQVVTAKLKETFDAGTNNAGNFQENLTAVNALIGKYLKNGNREEFARLYLLDAHIYSDGLNDVARAEAIWEQVVRDFPGTLAAKGAAISLAKNSVPEGLAVGQRFPDFKVTDVNGSPLSPSANRGRVTLIDFWATWCGPCRGEMPNVIAAYQNYHAQGFNIIGISLDGDLVTLQAFTQAEGMPWPQYYDGLGWQNKLAQRYGVGSIPANYLLDRRGIIVGKDLRGSDLRDAVPKALAGK